MARKAMDTSYGWFICVVSFCGQALSVGFFFAFGTLYVTLMEEFNIDEAQAAWIGSLAYSLCFFFGYTTSILCKRFGARKIMMAGGVCYGLGFIMSSFATHYSMLFVSYSLVVGFGASTAFFCSVLVLPLYFEKRLAFANGVVSSGSGFGGLIISPTLEYLLRVYGFRNAMRIYSGSSLLMIFGAFLYTRNYEEQKKEPNPKLIDKTLLKNKAYLIWSFCLCIILFGYYVPYVHLVNLAEEIGVSSQNASFLLSFASVSQIAGKIFFGKLADNPKVNRLLAYQCALLVLSVTVTLFPLSNNYTFLVVFSILFGFFEGCFSCYVLIITTDCVKRHQTNAAFGMTYSASSVFSLCGPPFAGIVFTSTGSYLVAFIVCGANITLSIIVMFLIPWFIPRDVYEEKFEEKQRLRKRLAQEIVYKSPPIPRWHDHSRVLQFLKPSKMLQASKSGLMKSLHDIVDSYAVFTKAQREPNDVLWPHLSGQSEFLIVDRVSCV